MAGRVRESIVSKGKGKELSRNVWGMVRTVSLEQNVKDRIVDWGKIVKVLECQTKKFEIYLQAKEGP